MVARLGRSLALPNCFERVRRWRRFTFNFAPLGTSSRKLANTGWPSSPTEAASSMPFDSKPRILRGSRLATITILRPTRLSGV